MAVTLNRVIMSILNLVTIYKPWHCTHAHAEFDEAILLQD